MGDVTLKQVIFAAAAIAQIPRRQLGCTQLQCLPVCYGRRIRGIQFVRARGTLGWKPHGSQGHDGFSC
jgi:hypothetical protein